jgi:hypothetical protein
MLPLMRGIVVASVTVALTALVGCGGHHLGSSSTTSSGSASTSSTPEQADAATIGQEVREGAGDRHGNFAYTVTRVDPPRKSIREQTAQGNYVAVYLTVTNIDNEPRQFWETDQMLKDAAGREYKNDVEATGALYLDEQDGHVDFNKSWLKPGNSKKYAVVFDLPVCVQPAEIELHDSPTSAGATVKL